MRKPLRRAGQIGRLLMHTFVRTSSLGETVRRLLCLAIAPLALLPGAVPADAQTIAPSRPDRKTAHAYLRTNFELGRDRSPAAVPGDCTASALARRRSGRCANHCAEPADSLRAWLVRQRLGLGAGVFNPVRCPPGAPEENRPAR